MKKLLIISALLLFAGTAFGQYWHLSGSNLQDYEAGGDPTVSHGAENSGFIESTASEIEGFGTLMTITRQDKYLGEKIRLTAYVKTENVKNWVGLWMRVDAGMDAISFDNMADRPITGSSDWENYEIVLDVPENGTSISYGIILAGTGKAWVDGLQLEKIDKTAGVAFGQTLKKDVVVGTFDSRVIAIAYYNSEEHISYVEGLKTEHVEAEASGDKERVKELETIGEASQELAHKQAFSTWPVDNILEIIEGKIPEIAKQADVDLIVSKWNIVYQRSGVEFIDVTDVMVKLFNPDKQMLEMLEQLKKQDPVPLEEL